MTPRTRLRHYLTLPLLTLILTLIPAGPASAHVTITLEEPTPNSSNAQPPTHLRLAFSEPLPTRHVTARLTQSTGQHPQTLTPSPTGAPLALTVTLPLDKPLPKASYTLTVTALGIDGHTMINKFYFAVGTTTLITEGGTPTTQSTAPNHTKVLANLADLIQTLSLAGIATAAPLITLFPSLLHHRTARRITYASITTCAAATITALSTQGPLNLNQSLTQNTIPLLTDTLNTQTGRLQCLRLLALAALALAFLKRTRSPSPATENALILSGFVVLLTFAASAHAAAAPLPMLSLMTAVIHLASTSLWVATLVVTTLACHYPHYTRSPEFHQALRTIVKLNPRLIGAAVISGLILTALITNGLTPSELLSPYGLALGIKLLVVIAALTLGLRTRTAFIGAAQSRPPRHAHPERRSTSAIRTVLAPQPTHNVVLISAAIELFVIAIVLLCASALSSWITL